MIQMNEFVKIRADLDKASIKKIKTILKRYKLNQKDMCDEIAAVIVKSMNSDGSIIITPNLVAEIKDDITANLNDLADFENKELKKILDNAYSEALQKTAKTIGIKTDWKLVREEFVNRAVNAPISGKTFSSRIWDNTTELANRIYKDVVSCIQNGEQPKRIIKKIKDDYGVSAYQAKRLVNTEVAKVVNAAQLDIYRESGVVQKVLYTATLETSTCENCADLDGKTYDLDKAPNLPLHPNCRCCLVPVVDGWKPKMRADNMTHQNIEYTTFNRWNN